LELLLGSPAMPFGNYSHITFSCVDSGMGVHSWKGISVEYLIIVYNIRNAVSGSKLDCLFIARKLCGWIGRFDTALWSLSPHCWFGYSPQGISLFLKTPFCSVSSGVFLALTKDATISQRRDV